MNPQRVHILRSAQSPEGPVLYWMHRDFRARDNWGLTHARQQALSSGQPLAVVFCLARAFAGATGTHFEFLIQGLQETERALKRDNIPLFVLHGEPGTEMARFAREHKAALVVTDFDPLRIKIRWIHDLLQSCDQPVHEVDSRNVTPARIVSGKREFMARTIRPKIKRLLPEFLDEFPVFPPHPHPWPTVCPSTDFSLIKAATGDDARPQFLTVEPGERAARAVLEKFLSDKLPRYIHRNDPNQDVGSNLSAHLHFGMISAQRVALETLAHGNHGEQTDSFLEELIIRRELADNFCLHTPDYDSVAGFPAWAEESLHKHRSDPRPAVYSPDEFENAQTHDPL